MEINTYLELNGVLRLSIEKELEKLVIWKEVFIREHREKKNDGNEYRYNYFKLIVTLLAHAFIYVCLGNEQT